MPSRVVVVDDQPEICELIRRVLNRAGYSVHVETSGEAAIENLKGNSASLLFIDKNMPGISGPETIKIAKQLIPGIMTILMTAYPEANIDKVADAVVLKPFDSVQGLVSLVGRVLASAKN